MSLSNENRWPELSYGRDHETYETLHLWSQIVGKTRLALLVAADLLGDFDQVGGRARVKVLALSGAGDFFHGLPLLRVHIETEEKVTKVRRAGAGAGKADWSARVTAGCGRMLRRSDLQEGSAGIHLRVRPGQHLADLAGDGIAGVQIKTPNL